MSDHYVNHNSQSKEGNVQENSFIDELYVNQHLRFQSPKEKKNHGKITMFSQLFLSQIRNVSQYHGHVLLKKLVMVQNRRHTYQ